MSKKKSNNPIQSLTKAPQGLLKFIGEARGELKKVSWPTRQMTIRYTGIVIVASLAVGMVIGGIDYLFTKILERVI